MTDGVIDFIHLDRMIPEDSVVECFTVLLEVVVGKLPYLCSLSITRILGGHITYFRLDKLFLELLFGVAVLRVQSLLQFFPVFDHRR